MQINIKDIIKKTIFMSTDDGKKVHDEIFKLLSLNTKVIISFGELDMLISHALNESIGKLYSEFNWNDLENSLEFINIDEDDLELLNTKVIPTAKQHFSEIKNLKTIKINNHD